MLGLEYHDRYWDDDERRRAFQQFILRIHNLDFGSWERAGFWDDDYRPFSFFDESGDVVSSVCLYTLPFVLEGRPCRATQVSGVGTLPGWRRRGLNRELTRRALEADGTSPRFVFLFADEDAIPFYRRCGFRALEEREPFVRIERGGREDRSGRAQRVDMADARDVERLRAALEERAPVSETLGVLSEKLFLFHALYSFREDLLYVEDLKTFVAQRREGSRLTLLDVVAREMPPLAELLPYLAGDGVDEVAFSFVPDRMAVADVRWRPLEGNGTHELEAAPCPLRGRPFRFPLTAHA